LRAVHALWNIRVDAAGRDESATTCLFALVASGRVVLAQLGDGLVLLRNAGGTTVLEPPHDRFGNTTTGLGIASDLRDWRVHVEPNVTGPISILLATDGVADDLVPDKRSDFLELLVARFGGLPSHGRRRAIAKELRSWPTPRHRDDKTVVVLWNGNDAEAE
jgi:hypothetical protein